MLMNTTKDKEKTTPGYSAGCGQNPYEQFKSSRLIMRDFLAIDRTVLANERTFLAYCRTGLALILTGAAYMKFFTGLLSSTIGIILMFFGIAVGAVGIRRTISMARRVRTAGKGRDPATVEPGPDEGEKEPDKHLE
jgi:putative membrane protein